MITKNEIVDMLSELSRFERGFKQQAFMNAASSIDILSIDEFNNCRDKGSFREISGIGKSANDLIIEAISTGKMSRLELYRKENENKTTYNFT